MKLIYNTKSIKLVSEDDLPFKKIETHPPERSNLKVWEGAIKRFPLKVVIGIQVYMDALTASASLLAAS